MAHVLTLIALEFAKDWQQKIRAVSVAGMVHLADQKAFYVNLDLTVKEIAVERLGRTDVVSVGAMVQLV